MKSLQDKLKNRYYSAKERQKAVPSLQALAYLQHGNYASIEITTPLGKRLKLITRFIGYSDDDCQLLFALPSNLSPKTFQEYFTAGRHVKVTVISEDGEGCLAQFNQQIKHIITKPMRLFSLELPAQAMLAELRQETRYRLNLPGELQYQNRRFEINLTDLSLHGCCFAISRLIESLQQDSSIRLSIQHPYNHQQYVLKGMIRNRRSAKGNSIYGVLLKEDKQANPQQLISALILHASRLSFPQDDQSPQNIN
ncbi:MAG: Cyclic di-GMP binding protein [Candidatus Celerinatantimonas neptuna]|nr:MAG: Cyclic di-GMP binding protein [Candidatus Celerinatantimonas neptuna]